MVSFTIRVKDLASHVRGAMIAGQEYIRRCNLSRLASSLHGHFGPELGRLLLAERGRDQRRPYRPRRDPIDAYPSLHQVKCQSSGEGHYSAFCCGVVQQLWASLVRHY